MTDIEKLYKDQLALEKSQIQRDYEKAQLDLDAAKLENQKATDANLRRTAVEAEKAQMNQAEYDAASGLTSGAKAQARLSRENQLAANMTAIRTAQQEADAQVERQRAILANEYAAAIREAQAENDLAKAQALYEQAAAAEKALQERKLDAAKYMAEYTGDTSYYESVLGITLPQQPKEPEEPAEESGDTPHWWEKLASGLGGLFGGGKGATQEEAGGQTNARTATARDFIAKYPLDGMGTTYSKEDLEKNISYWVDNGTISEEDAAYLIHYYGL